MSFEEAVRFDAYLPTRRSRNGTSYNRMPYFTLHIEFRHFIVRKILDVCRICNMRVDREWRLGSIHIIPHIHILYNTYREFVYQHCNKRLHILLTEECSCQVMFMFHVRYLTKLNVYKKSLKSWDKKLNLLKRNEKVSVLVGTTER